MKVKNFEKLIPLHLGSLYDKANDGEETITPLLSMLLNSPNMSEEAAFKFASTTLSNALSELEVSDPPEACYSTMGFVENGDELNNSFCLQVPGTTAFLIQIEKRERVLPGVSVRNAVTKRMEKLIAKEVDGWTPTRKDWAQLKEEVEAEMLKFAPIRPNRIPVLISMPYVYVFTSSAKVGENCTALIRKAFGTFPVEHALIDEYSLRLFMRQVIRREHNEFNATDFVHMKHDDGEDVEFKDVAILGNEHVDELISQSYTPRALDMAVALNTAGLENMFFRLTDKAILTGIHIGDADVDANYDATLENYQNDGASFLTLMANLFMMDKSLSALMARFNDVSMLAEITDSLEEDDEV